MTPTPTTTRELLGRYAGVLLDVYGVLLDARGPLPGAAELIGELAAPRHAVRDRDATTRRARRRHTRCASPVTASRSRPTAS